MVKFKVLQKLINLEEKNGLEEERIINKTISAIFAQLTERPKTLTHRKFHVWQRPHIMTDIIVKTTSLW